MNKIPRNALCPCGGEKKKWKNCCMLPKAEAIEHLKKASAITKRSLRQQERERARKEMGLPPRKKVSPLLVMGLAAMAYDYRPSSLPILKTAKPPKWRPK